MYRPKSRSLARISGFSNWPVGEGLPVPGILITDGEDAPEVVAALIDEEAGLDHSRGAKRSCSVLQARVSCSGGDASRSMRRACLPDVFPTRNLRAWPATFSATSF